VIGLDPYRVPGPWDPAPMAEAIAVGLARFASAGIRVESCLFGLDGSDDIKAVVTEALGGRPWEVVVVGGGVRRAEDRLELFERIMNRAHRHAPDAATAFNSTPAGTFDAARRWLDARAWGRRRRSEPVRGQASAVRSRFRRHVEHPEPRPRPGTSTSVRNLDLGTRRAYGRGRRASGPCRVRSSGVSA